MSRENNLHLLAAKNIRKRRLALGFSQEELADKSELHRTYIGAVERGERNITVNTLQQIATALKCNAIDLLSNNKEGKS